MSFFLRFSTLLLFGVCLISPLYAWTFGQTRSFACFEDKSQTPKKVTIFPKGDLTITWDKYPVTYDFIQGKYPRITSGGIWFKRNQYDVDTKIDELTRGTINQLVSPIDPYTDSSWIQTVVVVFELDKRILTFSEIGKNGFGIRLNCVDL